jgi:hypothetical protein
VLGKQTPGGDLTFQFRSEDLPPVCLAHFQKYIGTAYGGAGSLTGSCQYTFYPEDDVPNFGGSAYGTGAYTASKGDAYTISILKKFFNTSENSGINAQWFRSCIVDQMEFSCAANEDAKCKISVKAGNVSIGTAIGSLFDPNSSLGSYSTANSFLSWTATMVYAGGTVDVNKFMVTSKNNMEEHQVLGSINPQNYRYGRYEVEGAFELDFPRDGLKYFGSMIGGSSLALSATFYNGTSDWVAISLPNCRLKPFDVNMKGGAEEASFSLPFVAYAAENGSTAPITVTVHTLTYGSTPNTRV